ncbi:MAG: ABC transporter substrate-binding protein [Candidatus Methylomirabilia bacterium]
MKVRTAALILTLALGLVAEPLPAEAQKARKVYRIGILAPASAGGVGSVAHRVPPFLKVEFGYVEGTSAVFEYRQAVGTDERLPELAAELVRLPVDIIVTEGTLAIRAAKNTTRTIPIVMLTPEDPVEAGLVASLARPGGNITGVTSLVPELSGKRLQLLQEVVPGLTRVAVLWNPSDPTSAEEWRETLAAARLLGVELQSVEARSREDFEPAFEVATRERASALLVLSSPLFRFHVRTLGALATKSRLPTIYPQQGYVKYGEGLMSYGPSFIDLMRRLTAYVDKILKGAKPADLPVEQPTRYELTINLKTAKALGLRIPPSLLFQAEKVIK